MSTGFKNNNPTNINYYGGQLWEGATGQTTTTIDGQHNVIFEDIVFGLRAAMQLIYNKLTNNHYNLYNLVKNWTGFTDPNKIYNYCSVINLYANTDFSISPGASAIDPTLTNIYTIARGIVQNEIPEFNQITSDQWSQALAYYAGNDYAYNPANDNRSPFNQDTQSTSAGVSIWVILALAGAAAISFFKKK